MRFTIQSITSLYHTVFAIDGVRIIVRAGWGGGIFRTVILGIFWNKISEYTGIFGLTGMFSSIFFTSIFQIFQILQSLECVCPPV